MKKANKRKRYQGDLVWKPNPNQVPTVPPNDKIAPIKINMF